MVTAEATRHFETGKPPYDGSAHQLRRDQVGHWETDTMLGVDQAGSCILTLVERKTGYVVIGQLQARTTAEVNRRATQLIRRQPRAVPDDHSRPRHRVPWLLRDRARDPRPFLLRDAAPCVGTRDQRKHQRAHSPVLAQETEHDAPDATRLQYEP